MLTKRFGPVPGVIAYERGGGDRGLADPRRPCCDQRGDDPQTPWGGSKRSGDGREFGTFGIEAILEPQAILE